MILKFLEQKLPHIFNNFEISNRVKQNIINIIEHDKKIFEKKFLETIYFERHKKEESKKYLYPKIDVENEKNACIENPEDIIYYYDKDLNTTYQFNIQNLWERINDGNFINPYSDTVIDFDFIENFKKYYMNEILDKEKDKIKIIVEEEKTLVDPEFLYDLFHDLDVLENNITINDEGGNDVNEELNNDSFYKWLEKKEKRSNYDNITKDYMMFKCDIYGVAINKNTNDISGVFNLETNEMKFRDDDFLSKDILTSDISYRELELKLKSVKNNNIYAYIYCWRR